MAYYPPYFNRGNYINPMQTAPQMPMQNVPQMEYPQYQQMQQQTTDNMLWVLNENEAVSFPVAPNNSVVLWDKNNPTIYVKSVNMQGVPSMRVLDFTERTSNTSNSHENAPKMHKCTCGDKFVTKEEFDALKGKFYDILSKYDKLLIEQDKKEKDSSGWRYVICTLWFNRSSCPKVFILYN